MNNLSIQEKLNSIRNEMTHLWGSACATIGGAVILSLSPNATVGLFIGIIMINAYFIRRNEVVKIMNTLEE